MADRFEPPYADDPARVERARCIRYVRGHAPHHIQVRLCSESGDDDWLRVVVMDVAGELVVLADGDRLQRYRNHEAGYLRTVVASVGAEALFNTRYGALFLRPWPDGARSVFCLLDADDPLGECRSPSG